MHIARGSAPPRTSRRMVRHTKAGYSRGCLNRSISGFRCQSAKVKKSEFAEANHRWSTLSTTDAGTILWYAQDGPKIGTRDASGSQDAKYRASQPPKRCSSRLLSPDACNLTSTASPP